MQSSDLEHTGGFFSRLNVLFAADRITVQSVEAAVYFHVKEEKHIRKKIVLWKQVFKSQWHFVLVTAAELGAEHLQVINTSWGHPVFLGGGIWEYVSLKKHSCVYTHSYAHACTYAVLCAHTHTLSWSSWGVNFTPRLCECWPQNFATLWSEEFLKPKAVMCCFL